MDKLPVTLGEPFAPASQRWPVRTPVQKKRLEALCSQYRSSLTLDPPATQTQEGVLRGGRVAALGSGVRRHAELYAALTQREAVTYCESDVIDDESLDVVVATSGRVTGELLARTFRSERSKLPGFVCASSDEELETAVLLRSAAAVLKSPALGRDLFVAPFQMVDTVRNSGLDVIGRGASAHVVEGSIRGPNDVLMIQGHSDGIDVNLGPRLLCTVKHGDATRGPGAVPKCIATGTCHRLGISVPASIGDERLMDPAVVAARVLVMHTCWGYLPARSLVDREWAFLNPIMQSGRVGVAMAPWETVFVQFSDLLGLYEDLRSGVQVGEALHNYLCRVDTDGTGARMCLLGDPSVRLWRHE